MPKYDDFGRPIYETAEEYNRAHRTAGDVYTNVHQMTDREQENSTRRNVRQRTAAQRYATREGSKKAKTLVVGLITFVIVLNVVIVLFTFNMAGGRYEEAYREPDYAYEEEVKYYDEYQGDTDTPLPIGYENFTYNGTWITVPTTCKEIAELGYELETYALTDIVPSDFWENLSLLNEDGYTVAMISLSNKTGHDIPIEECAVEYFYIHNPNAYDEGEELPDFSFGEGYTFESSYEELESYLGVPYYHYEDHSEEDCYYDSYEWVYYGDDECQRVMVNLWNGKISEISIEKDVYED